MRKQGRAIVTTVARPNAILPCEKTVAPGGIDKIIRMYFPRNAVFGKGQIPPIRRSPALGYRTIFLQDSPGGCRVPEQYFIEIGAPDLIGKRQDRFHRVAKEKGLALAVIRRHEFRPRFVHADPGDLFGNPETFEDRKRMRQQGFADMKARVLRFIDQYDPPALLGEQARRRCTGGPAADDGDIVRAAFPGLSFGAFS